MTRTLGLLVAAFLSTGSAMAMDAESLTALLEDARTELEMPGLRAAVRDADGRVVRAAVGLADVEAGVPLDDTIGMPGGSTGKTFVAALTMLLVEDGVLRLDDPAAKWLGETDWYARLPNAREIRVRHLLSHTAGIADYEDLRWLQAAAIWRVLRRGSIYFEPEEIIGYALDRKAPFAVGQGYRYTDIGYLVLGRMIEAASGRAYYDLLGERILTPQQLDRVRPADRSILPDVAAGYTFGARNMREDGSTKYDPRAEWTGGGLVTTPTMLVEFYAALAEGRVVTRESFAQMLEAGFRDPEALDSHYGLGVFVWEGGRSFGHGGLWPGYRTHVVHDLETGTTVAVQTNRDGRLDMHSLANRIRTQNRFP